MKNRIKLVCIAIFISSSLIFSQSQSYLPINLSTNPEYLLKEYSAQRWIDSNFVNLWKSEYYYNQDNLQKERLFFNWADSTFNLSHRQLSSYSGLNLVERLSQNYNEGVFSNTQREVYYYDSDFNVNVSSVIIQQFVDDNWEYFALSTNAYDESNNRIEIKNYNWSNSDWYLLNTTVNTFDENNNKIESITEYEIYEEGWAPSSERHSYNYDSENNLIEIINYYKQSDGSWGKFSRNYYEYNGENMSIELIEFWSVKKWIAFQRFKLSYDSNNNIVESLLQIWDEETWKNYYKYTYKYTSITSVENNDGRLPSSYSLYQNYPNPFNPTTTIKFGLPEQGFVDLRVYNILGQEVIKLVNRELNAGYHEVNFGSNNLPSGIYIYKINVNGKFNSAKKMLLVK